jgi:hypothetical protein
MVFNGAIDHIIQNHPKARQNPRGLSQLDGYKRGLVNSLTGNLQKFGLDRVPHVKTLEDLLQDALAITRPESWWLCLFDRLRPCRLSSLQNLLPDVLMLSRDGFLAPLLNSRKPMLEGVHVAWRAAFAFQSCHARPSCDSTTVQTAATTFSLYILVASYPFVSPHIA